MAITDRWTRERRLSRRSMIRGASIGGIGLAGAALIGCGDDDEANGTPGTNDTGTPASNGTATGTPAASGEPRQGGTLYLNTAAAQGNYNPVVNGSERHELSGVHIYDRLFSPRMDERGYVLEAAESVEIADDTTIVFHLREGMVYQDRDPVNGRAVEAEDVVTVLEYARDEERAVRLFHQTSMDEVEAPDERTVVLTLQQPNAYLFAGTALGHATNVIAPRELVTDDFDLQEPIGSGPYQLREAQLQVRYEYERNPTYHRADEDLPYVDERILIAQTDVSAMEAAFRSEQLMVLQTFPAETADRLLQDMDDVIDVAEFTGLRSFTWNMAKSKEYFDDIRVREAFYRAFDPQPHIDLVANGWAVPVPGQLAAGLEVYQLDLSETDEYKRFDPEEARALLEAAGWDFDRTLDLSTSTDAENESSLQVLGGQLRDIGLNVAFNAAPSAEWVAGISATGEYDLAIYRHPPTDTPATPLRLNHSDPMLRHYYMGIQDPEIDALIDESEQAMDEDENIELVKEVQRRLLQEYAHLSYIYTAIERELKYSYIRDWESSQASGYHPMYRAEAWMDV